MSYVNTLRDTIARRKGVVALSLAILIAGVLTTVSLTIYQLQGVASLDLSRPGYEKIRTEVVAKNKLPTFSQTGPMDAGTVDEFKSIYARYRAELSKLGSFDSESLSDDQLRLADPSPQSAQ